MVNAFRRSSLITVSVLAFAVLATACAKKKSGGPGSKAISQMPPGAFGTTDGMIFFSGASAAQVDGFVLLPLQFFNPPDPACPVISSATSGNVTLVKGGCTDNTGTVWSGEIDVVAIESTSNFSLIFNQFKSSSTTTCNGMHLTETNLDDGTFTVANGTQYSADLVYDSSYVETADSHCGMTRSQTAYAYNWSKVQSGADTDGMNGPDDLVFNGSGKVGFYTTGAVSPTNGINGFVSASTVNEDVNNVICSSEAHGQRWRTHRRHHL